MKLALALTLTLAAGGTASAASLPIRTLSQPDMPAYVSSAELHADAHRAEVSLQLVPRDHSVLRLQVGVFMLHGNRVVAAEYFAVSGNTTALDRALDIHPQPGDRVVAAVTQADTASPS